MSSKWSPSFRLPHYNPVCISHLTHTCPMPHQSHHPSCHQRLPMHVSPVSLHFLPPRPSSPYVLGLCCSLKWQTKFLIHVQQQAELEFCIFHVSKNKESPGSPSFTETPHPFSTIHLQPTHNLHSCTVPTTMTSKHLECYTTQKKKQDSSVFWWTDL